MRVGVKETANQNLLEVNAEKFLGEGRAVEIHPGERTEIGDLFPGHKLHRKHARGAVMIDRRRNNDVLKLPQIGAKSW